MAFCSSVRSVGGVVSAMCQDCHKRLRASPRRATLAPGDAADLSHATAVALYGYGRWPLHPEISVPSDRRRNGIVIHRLTSSLDRRDVRRRHGLRATSPERTALDMAARLSARELER